MKSLISVIIFEDNTDLREGLELLVDSTDGFQVLATYPNCVGVKEAVEKHAPDVILMDIDMPEVNGIEGLKIIRQHHPETLVIMLTIFDQNEHVFDAMCAGANGYMLKKSSPEEIIKAIEEVTTGGAPMTPAIAKKVLSFFSQNRKVTPQENLLTTKEKEVLKLLVDGFSYKMIAAEMEISIDTVRTHIRHIYKKLQVNSMSEAVVKAIKQNLV